MDKRKKYLRAGFLLLLLLCVSGFRVQVQAEEETEEVDYTCGDSAVWSYDKASKTLTITGKGRVKTNSAWWSLKAKKIVVGEGITSLGKYCFNGLEFTEVVLPGSLEEIGTGVFSYNRKLKEIKIPSGVTVIKQSAFSGCNALEQVRMPDTVEKVGEYCFRSCKNLQIVRLPDGLEKIGRSTFERCSALREVNMPSEAVFIGKYAFSYCASLEKLELPESLEEISTQAFYRSGLAHVVIPASVKKLGKSAFYQCKNLRTARVEPELTKLPDWLFRGCEELTRVSFNDEVRTVGEYAFAGCVKLEKANFKGKLEVIQYKAFARTGFRNIRLEGNLRNVDYRAFQQCVRLKEVYVGKEIKRLYRNTFSGCSALKAYTVSEENQHFSSQDGSLLNRKGDTLLACPSGKKGVYLVPESVKKISSAAFVSCIGINEYRLASAGGKYTVQKGILYCDDGETLFACPPGKKGTVRIPSTVSCIKRNAFQCSGAKKIILPKKLKQMEYCSFRNCRNLESITIPGSVKKVDNAVFWGCQQLRRVTLNLGTREIARNAFFGCKKLQKVKVPATVEKIHDTAFASGNYRTVFYCARGSYAMDFVYRKGFPYHLV